MTTTDNKCIIKYLPGKGATGMWHCFSPDGKDMMAYTVKAWAEMFARTHGWTPVFEKEGGES